MAGDDMAFAMALTGYRRELRRDVGPDAEIRKLPTEDAVRMMLKYIDFKERLRASIPASAWNWSA
jgi:hypothetical protein